jgi:pyrroloquinoline-quinone synthase
VELGIGREPHGGICCRTPKLKERPVNFFDRLEAVSSRWNVLEHSFYVRWSSGELTPEELAFYAGEYRHAVVALAQGLAVTATAADASSRPQIERHAAEEAEHVELWDRFAAAAGASEDAPPRRETRACAESWSSGRDALEGLVTAYAIESAQPTISETKLAGLVEHYGFEEGPATEYFSLHARLDHEHAAESRALIEERLDGADQDRLLEVAEAALRGNWELLDGIERAFPVPSGAR